MMQSDCQLIAAGKQLTGAPTLPQYIAIDTHAHFFTSDDYLAVYDAIAAWIDETLVIIINCRFFGSYHRNTFAIRL